MRVALESARHARLLLGGIHCSRLVQAGDMSDESSPVEEPLTRVLHLAASLEEV